MMGKKIPLDVHDESTFIWAVGTPATITMSRRDSTEMKCAAAAGDTVPKTATSDAITAVTSPRAVRRRHAETLMFEPLTAERRPIRGDTACSVEADRNSFQALRGYLYPVNILLAGPDI